MQSLHNTVSVIKQILSVSKSWLTSLELMYWDRLHLITVFKILVNKNSLALVNMYFGTQVHISNQNINCVRSSH